MADSHCHLADEAFVADLDEVVGRARAAGLAEALCILTADDEAEVARAAAVRAVWPAVRFAAAVHPHKAGEYEGRAVEAAEATRRAAATVNVAAVGEIGLDYHYDFAPKAVQRDVFAAQVGLAVSLDRPVVIHTRLAMTDTASVLREAGAGRVRGVMHCFTGTSDEARQALDLGFYISLAGIVTFPKAAELRDVARFVPADRLLVETDAPYLAPVPYRGRRNEPAWVMATLEALAALRGVDAVTLAGVVLANYRALIGAPTAQT